jgi:threonine dehydrogenase-like Zn-dependent dehydrogenase
MNGVSHFDNGRRASFVLLVCANVLMMATASAPSPIYPLYRERRGFSVTMLTVIFAVYVEVDVVFDVIGGDILERSTELVRPGGTLVTIAMPPTVQPKDGRAVFFVVEPDRARLTDLAQRLRAGRLNPIVGAVRPLSETASAFARHRRTPGKTIIQVADEQGAQHS